MSVDSEVERDRSLCLIIVRGLRYRAEVEDARRGTSVMLRVNYSPSCRQLKGPGEFYSSPTLLMRVSG